MGHWMRIQLFWGYICCFFAIFLLVCAHGLVPDDLSISFYLSLSWDNWQKQSGYASLDFSNIKCACGSQKLQNDKTAFMVGKDNNCSICLSLYLSLHCTMYFLFTPATKTWGYIFYDLMSRAFQLHCPRWTIKFNIHSVHKCTFYHFHNLLNSLWCAKNSQGHTKYSRYTIWASISGRPSVKFNTNEQVKVKVKKINHFFNPHLLLKHNGNSI